MIPPVFDDSTPSPGERLLFERLQCEPGTDSWTVLHSLDIANHTTQVRGETDFLIVAPGLGVLCLEVKAHKRVARDADGYWRLGSHPPDERGPFKQANDQMQSIKRFIRKNNPDLARVPVLFAVWFTHCRSDLQPNMEWNEWELLDERDLSRPVAQTLTELIAKGRQHLAAKVRWIQDTGPNEQVCRRLVRLLRPKFELAVDHGALRSKREQHVLRFTNEQYDALDTMYRTPRVLFTGPAGTGKTFLALEAARRSACQGQSVLLVCYNRLLANWMAGVAADGVRVTTLHKLMLQATGLTPPEAASRDWWNEELPELAIEPLLNDAGAAADILIVDEAQDLSTSSYLDVLDVSVKGGLGGGEWRMFGDFERQSIFHKAAEGAVLKYAQDTVLAALRRNCRNTRRVGEMTQLLTQLAPGYTGFRRPDDGVNVILRPFASSADQGRLLLTQLRSFEDEGFTPDEIVILSPDVDGAAATSRDPVLRKRLSLLDQGGSGFVRHGTIHAFKGLDAPAVIVTDIDRLDHRGRDLLYIAMTRTTGPLCLLVSQTISSEIASLIEGGIGG
ncbi:NERD domain-containing protein [Nocardia sp. NPDC050412]|uniref:nuclease-related domain-containing DEAD/DEAH box helicase n=1 Tax=Nocardia sp. NPDC050412 TaxID=3364320 RepID=UPI0037B0BD67